VRPAAMPLRSSPPARVALRDDSAVCSASGNPRQNACGLRAEAVRDTMFRMTLMKPMPSISRGAS